MNDSACLRLATATAGLLLAAGTQAGTVTWQGPNSGFWDIVLNWRPAPPIAGDDVLLGASDSGFRAGSLALRSFSGSGLLALSGGSLSVSDASSIGALSMSNAAQLGGTGSVTVSAALPSSWTGGTFGGGGSTTLLGPLTISNPNNVARTVSGRSIMFSGLTTVSGGLNASPTILVNSGAVLTNAGTWLDTATVGWNIQASGTPASSFVNTGSYNKSGASTTTISAVFDNIRSGPGSGDINVLNGTLALSGGGSSNGKYDISAGAAVAFAGGTHTLQAISSGTGTGRLLTSAGTVNALGANAFAGLLAFSGGVMDVAGSFVAGGFDMSLNGLLKGSGAVTVTGALPSSWTGGTISGIGSLVFGGPLSITNPNNVTRAIDGGNITFAGITTVSGGLNIIPSILVSNGALLTNSGTWLDTSPVGWSMQANGGSQSSFVSTGAYTKSGAGTTTFSIRFDSVRNGPGSGEINVSAGTLAFTGGGSSNGRYDVGSAGTVAFGGGTYALDSISSGTGTGRLLTSAGIVNAAGVNVFAGQLAISGGEMNVINRFTAGGLDMSLNGVLRGAGVVTITGALPSRWTGGTMSGSGSTLVQGDLTIVNPNNVQRSVSERSVTFAGTTTVQGGLNIVPSILVSNGAVLTNSGSWRDTSPVGWEIRANGGTQPSFVNTGDYVKSGGSTTDLSTLKVVNTGTIDIQQGTLRLPADFANAGLVMGQGTAAVTTFTNDGHVAPGESPGTLTISGRFVQSARGTFDVELQTALLRDLLIVTSSAALDGTLNLICFAECSIAAGQTIKILDAASNALTGSFSSVVMSGFRAGAFTVVYDRINGDVLLNAIETTAPVPEPPLWVLLMTGFATLAFVPRTRVAIRTGRSANPAGSNRRPTHDGEARPGADAA